MAKQALSKHGNLKTKLVSFVGEEENVKREGEEKRKRKWRSSQDQEVWNSDFWYGNYFEYEFCMDHMEFKA